MSGMPAWWGRVFTGDRSGGNQTVVVAGRMPSADFADTASLLGVPDTAFVVGRSDRSLSLRTFSPVEELAQCWQTSLAAPVAVGASAGESWRIRHVGGDELIVHREGAISWARISESVQPREEPAEWPDFVDVAPQQGAGAVVLRQARSRTHLRCASPRQVEELTVAASDVLRWCERTGTSGVVLSAPAGPGHLRVRVFTTSLGGAEDSATGGAVAGVGLLAARAGARGDLLVRQGPAESVAQGHLRLRLQDEATIWLGGEVHTLMSGNLEVR